MNEETTKELQDAIESPEAAETMEDYAKELEASYKE